MSRKILLVAWFAALALALPAAASADPIDIGLVRRVRSAARVPPSRSAIARSGSGSTGLSHSRAIPSER